MESQKALHPIHGMTTARRPSRAVTVVDQAVLGGPADVDRLFERVEHELRARGLARPPADDTPGEHVDDERHVDHARPGRDVGKVAHPQPIGPVSGEPPVHPVQRTRRGFVANRCLHTPSSAHSFETQPVHQSRHSVAADLEALPQKLPPDLAGAIDPEVLSMDPQDRRA